LAACHKATTDTGSHRLRRAYVAARSRKLRAERPTPHVHSQSGLSVNELEGRSDHWGIMTAWLSLNPGIRRLLIVGYLVCVGNGAYILSQLESDEEIRRRTSARAEADNADRWERFSDPFFSESNMRSAKRRIGDAQREAERLIRENERMKVRGVLYFTLYPLLVAIGLWILAGFRAKEQ